MKKSIVLLVATLFVAGMSYGQSQKASETVKIKTPTVQCESCKKRIEKDLLRIDGIEKVNVDFKKKTTKVTYLTDRTNVENIRTAIANIGYDADEVTANGESYSKLPKCCQKSGE
ncbi:MAG: heavy-metal-associated domain-containing protein [Chitinophagaceae bacterium]